VKGIVYSMVTTITFSDHYQIELLSAFGLDILQTQNNTSDVLKKGHKHKNKSNCYLYPNDVRVLVVYDQNKGHLRENKLEQR
jgi:hypothetical protein